MGTLEELRPIFDPDAVAVIGARRASGPGSFNVVENLDEFGYDGDVYPVNPKADEVLGRTAYDDIRDVPEGVEHAVVFLPRHLVADVVRSCGEAGIPAVTIVSQGFADAGEEGAEMQAEVSAAADEYGINVVGPNTMGVHNFATNFTTAFAPIAQRDFDPIGVISQTGLFSMSFPDMPYATFIDLGNAAGLDHVDVLEYYAAHPDIEQVFMHIEGLQSGRGRELIEAAREAVEGGTSVLAIKTGRTDLGRSKAESHTGSLIGDDKVFDGAFEQARVHRVADYTEAQVTSRALLDLPPMAGTGIGMITHHGAAAIMALDAIEEFDMTLADIAPETAAAVQELSPDWLEIDNPIDLGPATVVDAPAAHEAAIEAALEDDAVDGLLASLHIADPSPWPLGVWGHIEAFEELAPQYDKPVVVVPVGTEQGETRARLADVENVLVLDDIRQAMRAFRTAYRETAFAAGGYP
ncbi:MAG: CoA-binding protein [Halobacteriales archaeon]